MERRVRVNVKHEDVNCSSQSPPRPAKRVCVDLAASSVCVLKEEDPAPVHTFIGSTKVSKLDPPAVQRPPAARCVASDAPTGLMSNDTVGVDQEGQDDKEEEMIRRDDRRDNGDGITEEAIDGLLNDEVHGQETNDRLGMGLKQTKTIKPFEERLEDLQSFKEKHGHVHVTVNHDKSLGQFCKNMRCARRGKGRRTMTITEDRVKALDELGFDWGDTTKASSVEERIEELKAFKEKHGHVHVTVKHDKSLALFCTNMRAARRGTNTGTVLTEDRIKSLDEMGFEWAPQEIK